MIEPLVSVIMPVYNAEDHVAESIASVIAQSYTNWELLIIDDESADDSLKLVTAIAEKEDRIKIFSTGTRSGSAQSRNTGIAHAAGRYIAFLDADDIWMNIKLERQIRFMMEKEIQFSFTDYEIIKADGRRTHKIISCPGRITYRQLLRSNTVGCLTAVYDAGKLGRMYMPDIMKRQDYGLWLNILRTGISGYGINENLALYRTGHTALSSNKLSVLKYNWQILREHQKLPLFHSIFYFCTFLLLKTFKYFS